MFMQEEAMSGDGLLLPPREKLYPKETFHASMQRYHRCDRSWRTVFVQYRKRCQKLPAHQQLPSRRVKCQSRIWTLYQASLMRMKQVGLCWPSMGPSSICAD
jgi:hypothetical protein